jgi:hypothetical protein
VIEDGIAAPIMRFGKLAAITKLENDFINHYQNEHSAGL